jgi:NAD-dependent SIR2 family protein deacetylase
MVTCSNCNQEIDTSQFGFFEENGLIYCEKCYADKRFGELRLNIVAIKKWLENVKANIVVELSTAQTDEEKKKVKEKWSKKIPSAWVKEVVGEATA